MTNYDPEPSWVNAEAHLEWLLRNPNHNAESQRGNSRGRDALHAFEAASIGYLAYKHFAPKYDPYDPNQEFYIEGYDFLFDGTKISGADAAAWAEKNLELKPGYAEIFRRREEESAHLQAQYGDGWRELKKMEQEIAAKREARKAARQVRKANRWWRRLI